MSLEQSKVRVFVVDDSVVIRNFLATTLTMLVKYFKQEGDCWRISEDIRSRVTFFKQNLLAP